MVLIGRGKGAVPPLLVDADHVTLCRTIVLR
jgi:hypothetical protein